MDNSGRRLTLTALSNYHFEEKKMSIVLSMSIQLFENVHKFINSMDINWIILSPLILDLETPYFLSVGGFRFD